MPQLGYATHISTMPVVDTVLPLSIFWILVHALNTYIKRSRQVPLLPNNITNTQSRSIRLERWSLSNTTLNVRNLHLTVSTTVWNSFYDRMVEKLRTKAYARTRCWMAMFYDIGVGIGLTGMLCAVCALAWLSGALLWDLVQISPSSLRVQKREATELSSPGVTITQTSNILFITPIIPGYTVPFGHLPVILLAVFLCQIFHEFGHAMSAALESISLLSVGGSLTVMFPSAHVSFPPRQIENLSPRRKGRIIAGGPWHNIVMWFAFLGMGRTSVWLEKTTSIGSAFLGLLYEDIRPVGRAVVNIEEGSPLKDFLLVGSIITHLDDIPLAVTKSGDDIWSTYLSGKDSDEFRVFDTKGWCVSRNTFHGRPNVCCSRLSNPALSCFIRKEVSLDSTDWNKGCLDPIDIFARSPPRTRCVKDEECRGTRNHHDSDLDAICVGPEDTTSFTRLVVRHHPGDTLGETLVWSGPKIEIWEQVKVSRWAPRFWFVPVKALVLAASFFEYLTMASLSLFFLNLLPVPLLDGGQLLKAILNNLPELGAGDFDIESMRSARNPERWKARIERGIMFWTTGMLVACVLMVLIRMMKN